MQSCSGSWGADTAVVGRASARRFEEPRLPSVESTSPRLLLGRRSHCDRARFLAIVYEKNCMRDVSQQRRSQLSTDFPERGPCESGRPFLRPCMHPPLADLETATSSETTKYERSALALRHTGLALEVSGLCIIRLRVWGLEMRCRHVERGLGCLSM